MLPPEVPHRTIGQFCEHVCMYVRFRPDHDAITEELTGHLEDHKDALLEGDPDMPLLEAEYRAVASMGDAEELGRWLDSIHSPVLGWFQIWFFRAVVLVGVLAGYLHSSVALNVGIVYGGMNLYNNGFAGGIVAIFLVPVIQSIEDRRARARRSLSL